MEGDAKVPPTHVGIPSHTRPQHYPHSLSSVTCRRRYDDGGGKGTRRSGRLQVAKEKKEEEENGENVWKKTDRTLFLQREREMVERKIVPEWELEVKRQSTELEGDICAK
ncbi:hypothetical protein AAFF_G00367250 [Aldrovandia affinis]|uniref:Uncharacterized protein n=1 Tax=Aldrovandia affinis TaxID=143900 RepID=A0AAD7WMS7_9TELE|nr:hypothetical protein AAFF_G00367250 [Aldrovandia affinis]